MFWAERPCHRFSDLWLPKPQSLSSYHRTLVQLETCPSREGLGGSQPLCIWRPPQVVKGLGGPQPLSIWTSREGLRGWRPAQVMKGWRPQPLSSCLEAASSRGANPCSVVVLLETSPSRERLGGPNACPSGGQPQVVSRRCIWRPPQVVKGWGALSIWRPPQVVKGWPQPLSIWRPPHVVKRWGPPTLVQF